MADNETTYTALNELIKICHDGHQGFRDAAEHIKNPDLKTFFNEQSLERSRFAGELEQEAQRLGKGQPDQSGHVAASVHRAWIDLKANLGGGDHAILSAVESGEDTAKRAYEAALESNLPQHILNIIRHQQTRVLEVHNRVRSLRDQLKAA